MIRHGKPDRFPVDPKTKVRPHDTPTVYGHMLRQICLDYGVLPDLETMSIARIVFFYEGLHLSLTRRTKRKKK